jgi:8-oxo-dGTP pyrophosphatase MutT (NUDIX family)
MNNPYRLRETKPIYDSRNFRVREDLVDGPGAKPYTFSVIEMRAGSSVLPMDDDGRVYLVREYKYAVERTTTEVASGGLEQGEAPLDAAKRELREEVGLTAREWVDLGCVDPFTTQLASPNYIFLARGLDHVDREPDEGEVLEITTVPFDQALEMVMSSEITHAASCVVILKTSEWLRRGSLRNASS